ncbi:hypothetical protein [Pseudomonas fluorescens]|uniref:portal protein n=1 Tax=Pseudomonas fluorescens TaxID=294 RepID=UPI000694EEEE|nr:hypothetical protein [Pseudomonas fluorescens]
MSAAKDPASAARLNHARYVRARDNGHSAYVVQADKFDGFYTGEKQWDEKTMAKLEAEGRPALTFNMILAVINTALGDQLSREVQVAFKPRRDASREVAFTLNKLTMQIMHANRYRYVEMSVLADGLIQDRGFFDVRMDFSDHMQGEVKIRSLDPRSVVLDPDAKEYDPNTWSEVMTSEWLSLDEIEGMYGKDKADQLRSATSAGDNIRYDSVRFEETTFGGKNGAGAPYAYGGSDADNRDIKSIRVVERQYYKWVNERMFVDPATGDMAEVPSGWDDAKMIAFAEKMQLSIHKRPGRRVRWTVSADSVTLYDDWSLYRTFSIVPFFPYFRRGKPFGMVRNLISPQEYLNKTRSQELHIVNTTANSGWTVEEGTLTNMTEDDLEERGAETGLVLVHARNSKPPQKIQPNQVPSGLDRISEKAAVSIREISGVNNGMLGQVASTVSGVAIDRQTAQGSVQLQVPTKNMELTRRIVAEKILELIQDFYTEERVVHITYDQDPKKADEQVLINTMNAAGQLVNDVTRGAYDVVITTLPNRDNFDESQFADLMGMRENGIAIPDTVIIRHSNLAERDSIADAVEKLLGQAEPSEQEVQMMQMQQQLAIQTTQAELQKLMAQAENFQSATALNVAKASQLAGGERAPTMDLERDRLESQIALKREELQTRIALAQLTHQARAQGEQLRTATDLARTRFQGEVQLESSQHKATRDNKTKPTPRKNQE